MICYPSCDTIIFYEILINNISLYRAENAGVQNHGMTPSPSPPQYYDD